MTVILSAILYLDEVEGGEIELSKTTDSAGLSCILLGSEISG